MSISISAGTVYTTFLVLFLTFSIALFHYFFFLIQLKTSFYLLLYIIDYNFCMRYRGGGAIGGSSYMGLQGARNFRTRLNIYSTKRRRIEFYGAQIIFICIALGYG